MKCEKFTYFWRSYSSMKRLSDFKFLFLLSHRKTVSSQSVIIFSKSPRKKNPARLLGVFCQIDCWTPDPHKRALICDWRYIYSINHNEAEFLHIKKRLIL